MKNIGRYFALHILLFCYSLGYIGSKYASRYEFFSFHFIMCYGIVLFLFFFYAIGWQQVLKCCSLVTAYANKAVTLIWGMMWGALIFGEQITLQKVLGTMIIITGIIWVVKSDND